MPTIGDVMTGSPVAVASQVTLREAVEVLVRYGIKEMPVVDGRVAIGTVSARDIIDFERRTGRPGCNRLTGHVVADAMSPAQIGARPRGEHLEEVV